VSPFSLDVFEVTVGRFRKFVEAYPESIPDPASGGNPRNPEDQGWDEEWNAHLPATHEELRGLLLTGCSGSTTWTDTPDGNESVPINCVSWYMAQAFCIWDGGRLPTQAEWNFVAAGGNEQRVYPWSVPPTNPVISDSYAVYDVSMPARVGSTEDGLGKWGHYDLAGNIADWVFDVFEVCYRTPDECNDCGYNATDNPQRTARGGGYLDFEDAVRVDSRTSYTDASRHQKFGLRCARDLE
jgi:formylglycine-generating enzyme required for sulfatase activity